MKTMFKYQLKFSANFFGGFKEIDKPHRFEFVKSFLLFFFKYFSTTIDSLIDRIFFSQYYFGTNVLFKMRRM